MQTFIDAHRRTIEDIIACHNMDANLSQDSQARKDAGRWLMHEILGNLILIALLFGIAGRWNWWMGWALSAIHILWTVLAVMLILPHHPAMLAERSRPHAGTNKRDIALMTAVGLLVMAEYIIASLDVRLGWSPRLPIPLQITGLVSAIAGCDFLLIWAMASNPFYITTVRIQRERQHTVISAGPYRYIRHPGYLGNLLLYWGAPFMLNSLWAIVPAGIITLALIIRIILEDKTLHAELPGYKEYAERVRYRLLPGLW